MGNPVAQNAVGFLLSRRSDVLSFSGTLSTMKPQSLAWYARAVEGGSASASFNVGTRYLHGTISRGQSHELVDKAMAIAWYRKAGLSASSWYRKSGLSASYSRTSEILSPLNTEESTIVLNIVPVVEAQLMEKLAGDVMLAARFGSPSLLEIVDALYDPGLCYLRGSTVAQVFLPRDEIRDGDETLLGNCSSRSSDGSSAPTIYELADSEIFWWANRSIEHHGEGLRFAAVQLQPSAPGSSSDVTVHLAEMYHKGEGVARDTETAALYYFKAAIGGDLTAASRLSMMVSGGWRLNMLERSLKANSANLSTMNSASELLTRLRQQQLRVQQQQQTSTRRSSNSQKQAISQQSTKSWSYAGCKILLVVYLLGLVFSFCVLESANRESKLKQAVLKLVSEFQNN